MMYQTGLVAVIKVNGQVLRENKDVVLLPFGAEYSILIKNLKSRRVLVSVSVDGTNATENTRLVIPANSEIELERFIHNGNLNAGNRFKFIQRTDQIESHRGIKVDDGIIRIEYWTEKSQPAFNWPSVVYYDNWKPNWPWQAMNTVNYSSGSDTLMRSMNTAGDPRGIPISANVNMLMQSSDEGITVPGTVSTQKFTTVSSFDVDSDSEVLILKLRGRMENTPVLQPVLVKTRVTCITCGKNNSTTNQFCSRCGTSVHVV